MKNVLKFIATFCLLVCIGVQPSAAQKLEWDSTYRQAKYPALVAKFKSELHSKNEIVFLGNSITAGADWTRLLNLPQAKNRGISGDITFGVLERLDEVISGNPSKVFILIGINDVSRNIPDSVVLGNYKKIIARIEKGSKRTKIYFYTLLPVNSSLGTKKNHYNKDGHILWLNAEIRKLGNKQVTIIDLYPHFLDASNRLMEKVTKDGLHLNAAGYQIWKEILFNLQVFR